MQIDGERAEGSAVVWLAVGLAWCGFLGDERGWRVLIPGDARKLRLEI
jgi:hypothetical protein